jgi:hypothetical protein
MPRYYFDTHDGDMPFPDVEGQDRNSMEEVRIQAQAGLADMARDVVPRDGPERTMVVAVRDEAGKIVLRAALILMVDIRA